MAISRPQLRLRPVILAVWLIAAVALAMPAGASAGPRADVSIMDDQLLLGASQAEVDKNMAIFRTLGVDRLRVSAFWNQIAPDEESRVRPGDFDAANPFEPRYRFAGLDRVVESASRHGLKIMVTITTPAPVWASREPQRDNKLWKPQPAEFGAFTAAVVGRYAPFVDHWGVSNEPNQGVWLQPQSDRIGAVAPHVYRSLVQAAYPRIKALDPDSLALVGELAAAGRQGTGDTVPLRPLRFLRAMACRDARYRPIRRGRCKNFQPVPMDAVGHHPYQLLLAPNLRSANKDDAAINDGRRLLKVVDRLTRLGAFQPGAGKRLDLYYTEFGYQTSPPDPFAGVSLSQQKAYLQKAAFIAWSTPRVREINQFRLTDGLLSGRGPQRFAEFQSGLLFRDRRPKPANAIFPHPFVISGTRFWGHVRPGAGHSVRVEYRRNSRGKFREVAQVLTSSRGYFNFRLRGRKPGQYRYRYSDPLATSGIVTVRR
ncbi:MAG: hypothetical protein WKF29_01010 [Thermoleophilaceae bacterium]